MTLPNILTVLYTLIRKGFFYIFVALVWLARILVALMVIVVGVNVFMRYVLSTGIAWAEEVALLLLVWFTFIAFALGVKKKIHISLKIIPDTIPETLRIILEKLENVVTLSVGIVMIVYGRTLVQFTMRSVMPSLGLPSGYLYLIVPIAGVLITYDSFMDLLGQDKLDSSLNKLFNDHEEEAHA